MASKASNQNRVEPVDHSVAEHVCAIAEGYKLYVCWWTYSANFADPISVYAKSSKEAFWICFPKFKYVSNPDFKKYVIEIKNKSAMVILP